ncbi:hypothetical protein MAHJHV61_18760 [Mycobacterium avium subsp. hominissuis]
MRGVRFSERSVRGHAVLVAGAGPTGLMLAGELGLAGVDVALVERRADQQLIGSRAGGLHARTLEILDQRGIVDRFLAEGQVAQVAGFAQIRLDISDFPTRHPYGLALWQNHIERILADWVGELGVPIYRGHRIATCTQDDTGVDVVASDGRTLRGQYLVGCDGGRSVIRKAAGIDFPGWEATTSYLLAEAEMDWRTGQSPQWGIHHDSLGVHALSETEPAGGVRVLVTERQLRSAAEPNLDDLRQALIAVYRTDYGIHSPRWISRFTDAARQAARYRDRRVLLAGDAAHIHHPVGGQGLNTGVQDAVNLGWKLALVVGGASPPALLDTYHAERHPVGERVLRNAIAQMALLRPDERTRALRDLVTELLGMDEPRKRFRRDDVRPGRSLRPGPGASAAGPAHARSRPGHRRRRIAGVRPAAKRPAGAAQFRRRRAPQRRRLGRSRARRRREMCCGLGTSGARAGERTAGGVDPAGRPRRVGRRPERPGAARCPHHLVRAARGRRMSARRW